MRAAAAEIVAQRLQYLRLGGMRVDRKQRLGAHDHAVEAVAALRGLFLDEGLLHRIRPLARAETFQRHDVAPGAAFDRDHAGTRGDAVDQHGAGAAFAEPAAIFRSVEFEIVAQHVEQSGVWRGVDVVIPAVHGQAHRAGAPLALCKDCENTTVCVQTCKPLMPRRSAMPGLWTRAAGKPRFYSAAGSFRPPCRLTGFGPARRIVRIRMNEAARRPPRELQRAGVFMAMEETATSGDKIRCDACPVMCYIKPGAAGACDRYANHDGRL